MAGNRDKAQGVQDENVRLRIAINKALVFARSRLRRQIALRGMVTSLFLPLFGCSAWIALERFTLLELPQWPVLIFPAVWLLCYAIWVSRQRIPAFLCAAYLDSALELDERLTTYLELDGREKLGLLTPGGAVFKAHLAQDTVRALDLSRESMPRGVGYKIQTRPALSVLFAAALLAAAILVPTSLDAFKSERNVVRTALDAEVKKLADLRAEIVSRPDVPASLKQDLNAELAALQAKLAAENADRADALATIADAEQKIRDLGPQTPSTDFEPVQRAAQLLSDGAADIVNSARQNIGESSNFKSVQDAIADLKPRLNRLTTLQARTLASDLTRAASLAAAKDSQLAQDLLDAAAALRQSEWAKAASALDDAGSRFQDATTQQQSAAAIEGTLSKLEDGSQKIAKAGGTTTKRGQVGFRRSAGSQSPPIPGAEGGQAAADQSANIQGSLNGQRIGQNQPAFGAGQSGGGAAQPGPASQGAGNSQGTGGQPSGQQPGQNGQTQGSGSGGGAGTGSQGGNLGRIVGPIGGSGGSQNAAGGAQGNGITAVGAQPGQQAGRNSSSERVYVPGNNSTAPLGTAGQAAPDKGANAAPGRAGDGPLGGDSSPTGTGLGSITTIHTPYTQVLGKYSEQAIQALNKAYVPPDAKDYVRDYFSGLGK